jgi:hypothetical protein
VALIREFHNRQVSGSTPLAAVPVSLFRIISIIHSPPFSISNCLIVSARQLPPESITLATPYARDAASGTGEIHWISAEVVSAAAWLRGVPRDDEDEEDEEEDKKHDDEDEEDEDDDGEGYSE